MDPAPLQSSLFTTLTEHDTKDKGIRVEATVRVGDVVCEHRAPCTILTTGLQGTSSEFLSIPS
jgi:hypothetical protein